MKNLNKSMKTSDNWFGNYDGNRVEVSLSVVYCGFDFVKFCVWGNDDTGMEIEFEPNESFSVKQYYDFAKTVYDNLPKVITKDYLRSIGFIDA